MRMLKRIRAGGGGGMDGLLEVFDLSLEIGPLLFAADASVEDFRFFGLELLVLLAAK